MITQLTSSKLVNTYLGTMDIVFDNYIDNISALVLGWTGRAGFAQKQYTLISSDEKSIFLKALPLMSIDEVKDLDTDTVITEYATSWASGIIRLNYAGNFQVKYTAGYLIDFVELEAVASEVVDFGSLDTSLFHTLPDDLTTVATQIVASLYEKSQGSAEGGVTTSNNIIASESVEGQSVSYFNKTGASMSEQILGGVQLTDYQALILNKYSLNDYL